MVRETRSGPRFSERFEDYGKRKPVEDGIVAHVGFADPVCPELSTALEARRGLAPLTRGAMRQLDRSRMREPTARPAAAPA